MDTTIEAGPVRFGTCPEFRASAVDLLVCACGWLETDHGELADARLTRARRRPSVAAHRRKAS